MQRSDSKSKSKLQLKIQLHHNIPKKESYLYKVTQEIKKVVIYQNVTDQVHLYLILNLICKHLRVKFIS